LLMEREANGVLRGQKTKKTFASNPVGRAQEQVAAKEEREEKEADLKAQWAAEAAQDCFVEIDDDGEEVDPDDVAPVGAAGQVVEQARVAIRAEEAENAFGGFIPSTGWVGVYEGYYFGSGAKGVGYYRDPACPGGGEFSRALDDAGRATAAAMATAADTMVRVAIAEDSNDDSDDSDDNDDVDESDLDQELLADLDSRGPEDSQTSEGLAGWFDEQVSTFRYIPEFKDKMLQRYGSDGAFQVALRAITDRRALRLIAGTHGGGQHASDRYNPQGSSDYKKHVKTLNDDESGPETVTPGKLAAKLRGEPTQNSADRRDYPNSKYNQKELKPEPAPVRLSAEAQAQLDQEQGSALATAEALKRAGNDAVKQRKYELSIAKYSEALSFVDRVRDNPTCAHSLCR